MTRFEWLCQAIQIDTDDCINWPFPCSTRYPTVTNRRLGLHGNAGRIALLIDGQKPPFDGAEALHSCDNTRCCNLRHLTWGTRTQNEHDKRRNGTNPLGERHGRAVLTEELVRQIRASRDTNQAWAERTGVSPSAISQARTHTTWTHVP